MTIDRNQLERLCAIARSAGEAILRVYSGAIAVSHKEDQSPLTQADLAAEAAIQAGLLEVFPGVPIWSEEAAKPDGVPGTFLLVDPLDGTKEFINRNGEFTVNIAFVVDGRPVAGVVGAPALDEMFFASTSEGAWHIKGSAAPRRLEASKLVPGAPLRVIGSRSHGSDATGEWLQKIGRPYELVGVGSSLKFCRLADGTADLYPRHGPTSQWDIAAGHAVLEAAGGRVLGLDGSELRYGLDRALLNPYFVALADPALLPELPLG